jgi:hypothetical protein
MKDMSENSVGEICLVLRYATHQAPISSTGKCSISYCVIIHLVILHLGSTHYSQFKISAPTGDSSPPHPKKRKRTKNFMLPPSEITPDEIICSEKLQKEEE